MKYTYNPFKNLTPDISEKADLVNGKVPTEQLPSYVDDVINVDNFAALPAEGEIGKIYVTLDTNKTYRWSGSVYIELNPQDLSNYYTKNQVDSLLPKKIAIITKGVSQSLTPGRNNLTFGTITTNEIGVSIYESSTGVFDIRFNDVGNFLVNYSFYTNGVNLNQTNYQMLTFFKNNSLGGFLQREENTSPYGDVDSRTIVWNGSFSIQSGNSTDYFRLSMISNAGLSGTLIPAFASITITKL